MMGCRPDAAASKAELPAPMVSVAAPTRQTVQPYEYFTGHVEAVNDVAIKAQVSGYLIKVSFTPGTLVEKGAPLFEIDPAPFQVELEKALASLALSKAREKQMAAEFLRVDELFKKGGASQAEFDKALANKLEAAASIQGSDAQVAAAKLNLAYAKIAAPLSGQIGDKLVSEGNLIAGGPGATTLTTIVSVDPIFVTFDIDENTAQRFQDAERQGRIKTKKVGEYEVDVGLSLHATAFPLRGIIRFANNVFDPKTGTIKMKASVANAPPAEGKRLLVPGMFARVRVPFGLPAEAMLVPETAILSDQGLKYIYVVGPENKAQRLDIIPGMTLDGRVVVEQSRESAGNSPRPLTATDRVIVSGVQRVRPGLVVDPKPVPQP